MITDKNKDLAQWAMDFALKNGCQASRVRLYNGSSSTFEIRDSKIDRLHQASENGMNIELFVDARYASFSTNRLDKKELEKFIKDNIESTRFLAEDKARELPDPSRYYKGGQPDLQLVDSNFDKINPDDKVKLAMDACGEIMGKDDRIISTNTAYSDSLYQQYMVASNGFEGENASTNFSLTASVSVHGEGDARPESFWYDSSLYYDSLVKKGIGTKALERVLRKIGQKKTKSGKYQMVVDNMNSAQLLSPILSALYGSSIQQKDSFLIDKLDQKLFSEKLTLFDKPHQPKTRGARYFDREGVATKESSIIDKGVLKTYFFDTYSANLMKTTPTLSSPSILMMEMGDRDVNGLIADIDKGILITGFNGGNSNSTTGDFSYGVEGFLIENGKLTQPISEMNVTGNFIELWKNLKAIGNDTLNSSSWKIPSLAFDNVDFSGL